MKEVQKKHSSREEIQELYAMAVREDKCVAVQSRMVGLDRNRDTLQVMNEK